MSTLGYIFIESTARHKQAGAEQTGVKEVARRQSGPSEQPANRALQAGEMLAARDDAESVAE